ncbi:MAG: acylphosphatase [Planctomycetota bacterium]
MERREVFYSGRVQGVGFRYQTTQVASRFDVVGFVRNLPDGRVHLVAEGQKSELDGFLTAMNEALAAYIRHHSVEDHPAKHEFQSFEIRR